MSDGSLHVLTRNVPAKEKYKKKLRYLLLPFFYHLQARNPNQQSRILGFNLTVDLRLLVMMMEGASNGGMLYHEVQESKLCAVHCVNTVLQGPFFSEFDLAAVASDLDRKERQVMIEGGGISGDFLSDESHNVSLDGHFSIQVLFFMTHYLFCLFSWKTMVE